MPVGEFVVGRSSSCHLALDDALVSRRHAVFTVSEDGVEVQDLGSRNGVQVNGTTIEGRQPVKHLDRVVIGAQELLLLRVQAEEPRDRHARPTLAGMTLDLPIPKADSPEDATVRGTESVLDRIADKALVMGKFDEAERMLGRRLKDMLVEVQSSKKITDEKLTVGTNYAMRLADGLKKPQWVDWIFEVHDATGRLLDAETIGRLHDLVRRIRYPGGKALKSYLANMQRRAESFSPAQRFLLQRLEGIERVVGA
jgi:pSer/pThr/pTyr-binding forkhead associated (FHA) protein